MEKYVHKKPIGGTFTSPGNRILKYNGGSYSNVSTGLSTNVITLLHHQNYLYIGLQGNNPGLCRLQISPPTPAPTPIPTPVTPTRTVIFFQLNFVLFDLLFSQFSHAE